MKFIFAIIMTLIFLPSWTSGQHKINTFKLEINITQVKNNQGKLHIAVFNKKTSENFPKSRKSFAGMWIQAKKGTTTAIFPRLPAGEYAIAVYHDENNNHKIDRNWIGFPAEGYGLSRNAKPSFGPPSYQDARFMLKTNQTISFHMTY